MTQNIIWNLSMVHAILSNCCTIISCKISILGILGLNGVVYNQNALSVDIESLTIIKGPDTHIAHGEVLGVALAVMRAIKSMKNEARDEPDISLKKVNDRNRKKILEEGTVLVEGGLSLWVLGDIVSCNGGDILQYANSRGTLAKKGEPVTPVTVSLIFFLRITINEIIFELEKYYQYTFM